jgi:hypothetical protein
LVALGGDLLNGLAGCEDWRVWGSHRACCRHSGWRMPL